MKKNKYKNKSTLLSVALSSTVILPILPFITSCSSLKNTGPTKINVGIDNTQCQQLEEIIQKYVNSNTITEKSNIENIQSQLLIELNNVPNENNVFSQVIINLVQPEFNSSTNLYEANVEIIINNEYKVTINDSKSKFIVKDNKLIFDVPLKTSIDFYKNPQFESRRENGLSNIGSYDIKVVGKHKRIPQTEVYSTTLMEKYGKNYKFVYPGYNKNYESNYGAGDDFFRQPTADKSLPWQIDGAPLVFNERVKDHPDKKYNDAGWISSEIKNNTFKKHPAAENFFANKIDNIDSIDVKFDLSTVITGNFTLGLFAPPGEVVTLTFDDETFEKITKSGWTSEIVINENFWDNREVGNSGQISNRYPFLESIWRLDKNTKTLQFGTPFGGGITLRINNRLYKDNLNLPFFDSVENIKFTVSGAIPCMFYQDGVTTEKEWENQKKLVKEQKLAPIIQGNGPFHAFTIPFSDLNRIGEYSVDDLKFPAENFRKWNDFLYLSNYYAGRDLDNNIRRLNMEFCDDIWDNALAWGGGMNFWCPVNWGVISFFSGKPIETFNPSTSWGVFHEINHNFQQNNALFSKRSHGETNQVTAFNLSVISDGGRARSELNYSGDPNTDNNKLGWARLNNPYITIYDIVRKGTTDEYPIYSLLLFMFGSKRYSDYLRWDVRNHPNTIKGWTGFDEIKTLSNYFKLNLWPAFFDYGKYWNDSWPTSNEQITADQRLIINELSNKYPAVDFVANHYACGNYIYNSTTKEFEYGGDITTPWEIEAGKPVVLHLNQFINSTNKKFKWNAVEFNETTTHGGKLELLENNNLKYTPPKDPSIIDEFDISIIPGTWTDKPTNYVPKYKFKIKMRQVVNEPILTLYEDLSGNNIDQNFEDIFSGKINVKYSQPMAIYNTNKFTNSSAKQAIKIDFNFVAPKDSTYVFKAKWDDAIRIRFDGNEVYKNNSWTNDFKELQTKKLKKGDVLHVEAFVINTGGQGGFDLQVFDSEGNSINWMENALIPDYVNVVDKNLSPSEVLSCDKYKYKTRTIDKDVFDSDLTSNMNFSDYQIPVYDPKKYILTSKYKETNVQNLNDFGPNYFEIWNNEQDVNKGYTRSSFQVEFKEPTLISTLYFGHRTNNHNNARPTHIKIIGHEKSNSTDNIVLYDGVYGQEFCDRGKDYSILTLNKSINALSLEIIAYNETKPENINKGNGVIWQWFRCSGERYNKIKSNISVNDSIFTFSDNWIFKNNDEENNSSFNNLYAVSKNKGDIVRINLKNKLGFNLIGQANTIPTQINIYINKEKINTLPITISADTRIDNHCLYQFRANNPQDMTIEIEHLDNNPLFLNYIMLF